jgi:hypothetical protein
MARISGYSSYAVSAGSVAESFVLMVAWQRFSGSHDAGKPQKNQSFSKGRDKQSSVVLA